MRAGLLDCASALPETVVDNSFFASGEATGMFAGTSLRRHLAPEQSAADLITAAAETLLERNDISPGDIDAILTNVSLPDEPFLGCGAEVKRRLEIGGNWVLDLHNTGCVSFVYMLELARSMIDSGQIETALICNVQTAAGRVFALPDNRVRPPSAIPGDGCGVGLIRRDGPSPVLAMAHRCIAEHATDMRSTRDGGAAWWEPGDSALRIDFNPDTIASIIERGNSLVPDVVREACAQAGRITDELDLLITNQPNPQFLEHWRSALGLAPEQHVHTFSEFANLFGAAIPINLDRALRTGRVADGDLVCLAGFSHAGDFAAAALMQWGAANPVLN